MAPTGLAIGVAPRESLGHDQAESALQGRLDDALTYGCPICGGHGVASRVRRDQLPVLQNVTYASRQDAMAAPSGRFVLATCSSCGFCWNGEFDPGLVLYDDEYDNHVQSAVFESYYRGLASMMADRFELHEGFVYDIGCGKGEFLRELRRAAPDVTGIGIDPSCTTTSENGLRLIQDRFNRSHFRSNARLVLLRHVLEHVDDPLSFLEELRSCMPNTHLYVEVPDLDWILKNGVFWDFCYEHCNYFTQPTLRFVLEMAGFEVIDQRPSFGDQYQWAICRPREFDQEVHPPDAGQALAATDEYATIERDRLGAVRRLAESANGIVIWGMATKGVILATMLADGLVAGGVDMNGAKQGRFAATSGLAIHPPEFVGVRSGAKVLVMNPNYLAEIEQLVSDLGVEAQLICP